jgi:GT2 family glycosyltransferase
MTPLVSVVIATRNRRLDLMSALASVSGQTYPRIELLVYDDASDDDTESSVRRRYPQVQLMRSDRRVGYISLRNRGFREARGRFVFSIDDDAEYTGDDTIARTVEQFEADDRIAAIAMPFVEPGRTAGFFVPPTGVVRTELRSFVGCAAALRRETVTRLGGYREFFTHQGEERDLCIRLLSAGYSIVYGKARPVVHRGSPRRDPARIWRFGIQNTLLFDWLNVPHPFVLPRMTADAVRLLTHKLRPNDALARLGYLWQALKTCAGHAREREPVSVPCYRRFRSLPRHGPERWDSGMTLPSCASGLTVGYPAERV